MLRTLVCFLLLLALRLVVAPAAHAQQTAGSDDERARVHFESGGVHFEAGDYESALREFDAAYALSHRPELLYNIYLCEERLGHLPEAIEKLEAFLSSDLDIPNRDTLTQRLENLRRREAGDTSVSIEPEEPAATETESSGANVPAIVSFVTGGVGAVLWGTFGILAALEHSDLNGTCGADCPPGDVDPLRTFDIVADIGFGVTLAGAALGVVFLLIGSGDSDDDPDTRAMRIAPFAGPTSAGLTVAGRL